MGISATIVAVAALSTASVTDQVGVNTHLDFNNWGYQNVAQTIADINYLGLKHLRDCPNHPSAWQQVATGTGAKFLAFIGETSLSGAQAQLANMPALAALLDGVEGANEWDDAYSLSQGVDLQKGATFQQQVYQAGQTLHLPVVNMSFGAGWTATNNWQGDYGKVGDLSAVADYGNAHTYPTVGQGTSSSMSRLNGLAKLAAASRPVMTTEIGWNGSQYTSEQEVARHTLEAVFDAVKLGNSKLYFYALYDDGSGNFGFYRRGTSVPKASGVALHNLMALIADTGAAAPSALAYGVTGAAANDNALLMEKSSGVFELALWNESDAPHAVTVNFGAAAQTINLYDPLTGTAVTQTAANSNTFAMTVPDHPVIVEIVGANVSVPPPVVTPPPPPPPPVVTPPPPPVTVSLSPHPAWGPPAALVAKAGVPAHIAGLAVSDQWADGHAGTMALNLSVANGTLAGTDATGKALPDSGMAKLHVKDGLAAVNAVLAGLTYSSTTVGPDALILDIWDQAGIEATKVVPITVVP